MPSHDSVNWANYWTSVGRTPVESSKQKWADYYDFMLRGILKDGTYGVSIDEVRNAIRRGDSTARIALKHLEPSRLKWETGNLIDNECTTRRVLK